jgi:hypothetical protein
MGFVCPACHAPALAIDARLELPADARSDEIALQTLTCARCAFEAVGIYEESRRGAGESVDHRGHRADPARVRELRELMRKCKTPDRRACACEAHAALGKLDRDGRWLLPEQLGEPFPLTWSR